MGANDGVGTVDATRARVPYMGWRCGIPTIFFVKGLTHVATSSMIPPTVSQWGLAQVKGGGKMKVTIDLPDTVNVLIPKQGTVAIHTRQWTEEFVLEAINRAVKEYTLQRARTNNLGQGLMALECGTWSYRQLAAEAHKKEKEIKVRARLQKVVARLTPTERAILLGELYNEHDNNKPG